MKQNFKQILFVFLLTFLLILCLIPSKSYSADEKPGVKSGVGPYGPMCSCPEDYPNCGCAIVPVG